MSAWEALTPEQRDALREAAFELDEKYHLPVTNNELRVQDGVQLHDVGDFIGDLAEVVAKVNQAARVTPGTHRNGEPEETPETRLWRTLVVIVRVDGEQGGNMAYVRVPGWAGKGTVLVDATKIPFEPTPLPYRCHAKVNIGAERAADLRFSDWEPTRADDPDREARNADEARAFMLAAAEPWREKP